MFASRGIERVRAGEGVGDFETLGSERIDERIGDGRFVFNQ